MGEDKSSPDSDEPGKKKIKLDDVRKTDDSSEANGSKFNMFAEQARREKEEDTRPARDRGPATRWPSTWRTPRRSPCRKEEEVKFSRVCLQPTSLRRTNLKDTGSPLIQDTIVDFRFMIQIIYTVKMFLW